MSPGQMPGLRIFCLRPSPGFRRCPSCNPSEIPLSSAHGWPLIIDEPWSGKVGGGLDVTEPNEMSPLPSSPLHCSQLGELGLRVMFSSDAAPKR